MSGKDHPAAHFEVDDPVEAFRKFKEAARKIMSVPKKQVDEAMARDKAAKRRTKRA